jgi:NADH dehydrogenase
MDKKNIVVLGAGFGGLRSAMDIAKKLRHLSLLEKYTVTLVDRNDSHLYTPLLYKLAMSDDNGYESKCTYSISDLVKNVSLTFIQSEVNGLDLVNGDIRLKNGQTLKADYLVLSLGSETNYFGIPGLQENSLQWKTLNDALAVRKKIAAIFAKSGTVNIIAGGAGPNGIELAASLRLWADRAQEEDPKLHVSVSLLEAMPTIMTGLDPRAAVLASNRLKKLGINIKTSAKIVGVSKNEISIDGADAMPFDAFIWTGGIKTPEIVTGLPVTKEPHGKPMMKTDMACTPGTPDLKLSPMIYGLGDSVCFINSKTGKPVPAVARAAILEAGIAAHNLIEEIKHSESASYKPKVKNYKPSDYPYVIPVGENWAVAKIGPIVFSGWLGELFEKLVALHYLVSIMPLEGAFAAWKKM